MGAAFVLGGTCQGGIMALAMARRLKQIGRSPLFLALLEWSYSYGSYSRAGFIDLWRRQLHCGDYIGSLKSPR